MTELELPEPNSLRIVQAPQAINEKRLERVDFLIVVLPPTHTESALADLPYADRMRAALRRSRALSAVPAVRLGLPNQRNTGTSLAVLPKDASTFQYLTLARKLIADALSVNPTNIAVAAPGLPEASVKRVMEAMAAAAMAAAFEMPTFKSSPPQRSRFRNLNLLGHGERMQLDRTNAEAVGNNMARWLTALPPNQLAVNVYVDLVRRLARSHGWKLRFHDERALKKSGAGAFLAVGQASKNPDSGIVHLRYEPANRTPGRPRLALVGKGICFDTGGVNLKPFRGMLDMHHDMQGSAVALGTLLALSELEVDYPIDCWLALSENQIGPGAYKSHDVVTACNGTTIEVIHTDAEGRMVLADTLALAARRKPGVIIDFATLTGTCVTALTTRYSGVFTNQPKLDGLLRSAGSGSGERVWTFPLDDDFDEDLESKLADVRQCDIGSDGDHIHAARFLKRFVPDNIPWIHVDMAAGNRKGGLGHIPTEVIGFGVRFAVHLLQTEGLLDRAGD
ncbi:MAG: leucyl aminopeptidase family protein [Pseudomonadota bacterium]